jgi:hypothetical protein
MIQNDTPEWNTKPRSQACRHVLQPCGGNR